MRETPGQVLRAFRRAKGIKSCLSFALNYIEDQWSSDTQGRLERGKTSFTDWHLDTLVKYNLIRKGDPWYLRFKIAIAGDELYPSGQEDEEIGDDPATVVIDLRNRALPSGTRLVILLMVLISLAYSVAQFHNRYVWVSNSDPVWEIGGRGGAIRDYDRRLFWVLARLVKSPGVFLRVDVVPFLTRHLRGWWYEQEVIEHMRASGHEGPPAPEGCSEY